jgi:uncharacterized RDD family membrane protein YckC
VTIAPFFQRTAAFTTDLLIVALMNLGLSAVYAEAEVGEQTALALFMVATATYHIGFLVTRSATPGKMMVGIYVSDREGRPLRPDVAILRYLTFLAGGVIIVGTVVSVALFVVDTKQRRTVHDRVAGTMVVLGRTRGEEDNGG